MRSRKTVKALGLAALTVSLCAIIVPVGQFAVAILAVILAIVAGFCGEVIYTTATAAVTAVNMAMLAPHDDLVMTERPVQVYWTALLWAVAPVVSMIAGYLIRLRSHQGSPSPRSSDQAHKRPGAI